MSYVALYRKWRPDAFSEVKGQEHIVTTLKNQVTHDRIGHAYLFCGTRGTGKTTVAKLFAKAVNCEHPLPDGSPCNECTSCKSISSGNSMNVMEIDAASNNGVDNIRDIKDSVQYSPTEGRYKVYIIDEVHMLSIGAFNALLKTLEEPPSYVIFILATTESHKIPITILSRCQKYDFRRISIETITNRLMDLLQRENVEYEEKAIRYIAKVADGSMRDGLSLLDQCIAFHLGECLTYDKVLEVLGAVDIEIFDSMLTHIQNTNVLKAVDLLDEIMWQGRDLNQFVTDFTWYLRNLLLVCGSEQAIEQVDVSNEHKELLLQKASQLETDTLMRYIRILSEVSASMRYASQKRVTLELAIIKLCKPQMETDYTSVVERLRVLEKKLEEGVLTAPVAEQRMVVSEQTKPAEPQMDFEAEIKKVLPPAEAEQILKVWGEWEKISAKLPQPMRSHVEMSQLNVNENHNGLVLSYNTTNDQGYRYFSNSERLGELQQIVGDVTGFMITFTCTVNQNRQNSHGIYGYNMLSNKINTKIEYED